MYPKLLELGPITLYTYGVLLAAAYLAGLKLAMSRAKTRGLDSTRVLDLGIYIIISALVGAKLLLLVTDFGAYTSNPRELLTLARVGGVFYGGLILAVLVSLWYMRRHRMPLWPTCDAFAPGIALGHAIGRLGCFLAGCCYGRPTDAPWGVIFTDAFTSSYVGTPLHVALHPVQLYESAAEIVILALLLLLERRSRGFAGRTFWTYVLLYGVVRFGLEFFRGDERGAVLGLSTSQFISVVLVVLATAVFLRLRRSPAPAPAPPVAPRARRRGKH